MSKKARVVLRLSGLNKLMRSEPVQAEVNKAAARVAAKAGPKFQVKPSTHRWVARSFVEPKPGVTVSHADRASLLRALN